VAPLAMAGMHAELHAQALALGIGRSHGVSHVGAEERQGRQPVQEIPWSTLRGNVEATLRGVGLGAGPHDWGQTHPG
jgi:hypothetical protein